MAGGGACGLLTAMLLAKDGHEVVVLERDPALPPPPADAWDVWDRSGVTQFRLPHGLLSRFRLDASIELPAVVERLRNEGAYEKNMAGPDGPDHLIWLTGNRPFVEACIAAESETVPGVDIRRGVAVAGLVPGPEVAAGTPHVVGVRLDSGEELVGDLVIDSGGRRSALPRWVEELGGRAPVEEKEDSGFVYYGTHFQASDGQQRAIGPPVRTFGSISVLALPGEHATWGLGLITVKGDAELRCLKDEATWMRVMRGLPDGEPLLEGKPRHEIRTMSGIEDRLRRYVVDGAPVITGILPLADAAAATNPSKGRGIGMGFMHAIGLRNLLRDMGLDDPLALALAFDEMTETVVTPHYRSTVWDDRHRLAQVAAHRLGEPVDWSDDKWRRWNQFLAMANTSDALRPKFFDTMLLLKTPDDILADPEVKAELEEAGDSDPPEPGGPSRGELLELARG